MEKETATLFLSCTSLMIFLFLSSVVTKKKKIVRKISQNPTISKLPPGPQKLPLIGNLHQLAGSLPWRAFDDLSKKHGPIMHLLIGQVSTVVVSSPRLAKQALKTHECSLGDRPESFATETLFYNKRDIAFAPYGAHWRHLRKICTLELLSNKKVSSFSSMRAQVVSDVIETIRSSLEAPFNLTEEVFSLTNNITRRAVFGHRFQDYDKFIPLLKYQVDSLGNYIISDIFPSLRILNVFSVSKLKLAQIQKRVDGVLDKVIGEHRNKRPRLDEKEGKSDREENLLDVLIRLQQSKDGEFRIRDTDIKAVILDMFVAGSGTSSTIVEWAFTEMLNSPGIMEKAQAEVRLVVGESKVVEQSDCEKLDYLKMVIKETLRLHPPVPLIPGVCRKVCEIDRYTIPVKTQVYANVWTIGRDPSVWGDDAQSFKPERFQNNCISFTGTNFAFIPFGAGQRICPGISYGTAVVEIVLANLLYHFDWQLPEGMDPKDLDMNENFGMVARRKNPLYVVPVSPNS